MQRFSIICAYHFHQLLPAIIAVNYYRKVKKLDPSEPVLIYVASVSSIEKKLITTAFPSFKFIKNTFWIKASLLNVVPMKIGANILQKIYGKNFFDVIYFPHDATSDFIPQTFMQAFPKAERICYGDAFGNLIERNYFESFIHQSIKTTHDFFAYLKRKLKVFGCHSLTSQTAILTIPVDFSGKSKDISALLIPPKEYAQAILTQLTRSNFSFNDYVDELIAQSQTPRYLFLLTNFSESKLLNSANEVLFFEGVVEQYVPKGATLILKPHGGNCSDVIERLASCCRENGHIVHVFPKEFWSIPIELAEELVKSSQVLSVSYANISLAYFFNVQVHSVLNNTFIKKYFFVDKQKWLTHHNQIYATVYNRLEKWNGKDFLYTP